MMVDDLPAGATPLDPDEADGLIPQHISTRGELDAWEQVNIAEGRAWLRKRRANASVLTMKVVHELHRQMFSDTWRWAGRFRQTLKNIGAPPESITEHTQNLIADTRFWIQNHTYSPDEIACRFHHRLVAIHPFPNGNGRHARLLTEALLEEMQIAPFTWGSGSLDDKGDVRDRYIRALRAADMGDYAPLLAFVRS
jgi:Fic-DOC domain mobile mystery protein B